MSYNPRKLKRFKNLFKFRVMTANINDMFDATDDSEPLSFFGLAKFTPLDIEWPELSTALDSNEELIEKLQVNAVNDVPVTELNDERQERWLADNSLQRVLKYGFSQTAVEDFEELEKTYRLSARHTRNLLQVVPRRGSDTDTALRSTF